MQNYRSVLKSKLKAFTIHACFTLVVGLLSAGVVFGLWYPAEFSSMVQGANIYFLILGVELVLGPTMSLVIFNSKKPKKELVRDYSIICTVQISALLYGLFVAAASRPVFVVFVKDRLEVVVASELEKEDLSMASSDSFKKLSYFGPIFVCSESPKDPYEKSELLMSALEGKDIQLQPRYYRDCHINEVVNAAFEMEKIEALTPLDLDSFSSELREKGFKWMPAVTRFGAWIALFPKDDDKGFASFPIYIDMFPFDE